MFSTLFCLKLHYFILYDRIYDDDGGMLLC